MQHFAVIANYGPEIDLNPLNDGFPERRCGAARPYQASSWSKKVGAQLRRSADAAGGGIERMPSRGATRL